MGIPRFRLWIPVFLPCLLIWGLFLGLSGRTEGDRQGAGHAGHVAAAPGDTRTIYEIQYTTAPGSDNTYPSPYNTQVVTTSGTVCAVLNRGYIISEDNGPWRSLYVYVGASGTKPPVGTLTQVRGSISEYQGTTEYSSPTRVRQMGPGPTTCQPTVVTAAQAPYNNPALTEPYESVIVEYRNITITAMDTYAAYFVDATGNTGAISRNSTYSYVPPGGFAVGQRYEYVRGPLITYYQQYRVYIPSADDIQLLDITPPTVTATNPAGGATGVNPHKPIAATFSEPISPTTVTTASFTLVGPSGSVAGSVSYDDPSRTATFTPAAALAPNTRFTATLTTAIADRKNNHLVADHIWSFTTGPLDTTPPTVVARSPAVNGTGAPLGGNIVITFSEELKPTTVVAANFSLTGPYGAVPWDSITYDAVHSVATLNPRGLLLPSSRYTVTIAAAITDWAGYPVAAADRSWSFTTQAEPEMHAYLGDIHNHTSYSDGSGTPEQAFASAQTCGLDFLAVTDHSYAIDDGEWADILAQANAATVNGVFVGLRGFEYTQGAEGHINVYNSVRHAVRSDTGCAYCDYTPNLEQGVTVEGFYHWLAITGTQAVDTNGTVMQFNHPGWINFNDWTYHPEVENTAELEEVGNGWDTSYTFSWEEWVRSLDYGWRVGATNNSDNHALHWGCITPHRTGVVMPALTKADLLDALRSRRTYASEDADFALFFKANGYWMGSEIPNTGQIAFEVRGSDTVTDPTALVELYTDGGRVVSSTHPAAGSFTWNFSLDVSPGVHYYFVRVTQADGDRIVSSPVWTMGDADISITDLSVQPTIPTIYNPSLFTARVTNRGAEAQSLTVTFSANGAVIGQVPLTVNPCATGPCNDGYANVAWQPTTTGPLVVTATLSGAPASDNPEDNSRVLQMNVTSVHVPLVLVDNGHNNIGSGPRDARHFVDDLSLHGYNVLFNLDEITPSDLNTETVRLLVLNAFGPEPLTITETNAIADFVAAGGNLWLNGMSDYTGKVWWAYDLSDRMNDLVDAIEARIGTNIPIRFNDDEVLDGNNNNGYQWGVVWHLFPVSQTTGVGMNVLNIQSWSDVSLVDRNHQALTQDDLGTNGFLFVVGDLDPGVSNGAHYTNVPNRTHNTDADGDGDAYIYGTTEVLPGAAGYDIPGPAGRLFFYGDSNDPFNVFAYVAGDGKQNELFNLEAVMWLLGEPLQRQTVAQVRTDPEEDDVPVNLDRLVWTEGFVTAAYGEFFDVLYIQDDTGGITVFAPAGTASGAVEAMPDRGDCVRVVGTVDVYQGDTEIQFFESEQVQVLTPTCVLSPSLSITGSVPLPLNTHDAALEANEGWLVVVTGTVTARSGSDAIWVDDGSGPVRAFLDGYNGDWGDIGLLDRVSVAGMASEDGNGSRIRVRNHGMHPLIPDDVRMVAPAAHIRLPVVLRRYRP